MDINKTLQRNVPVFLVIITCSNVFGQYDSLAYEGYQRTYLVHLPTQINYREPLPLVIAMHGGFGSADNLQRQSGLSETADRNKFIVVYPEGLNDGPLGIRTWNAGWCCGFSSATNIDDVGFINALIDTLLSKFPIDTNRIYATGMSNGGFMSYRLACELSARIAAIAPVACSMSLASCNPERPVPVIHFHSYLDESVLYAGGIGNGISDHYNTPIDSVALSFANQNECTVRKDTILDDGKYTHIQWRDCRCNAEIDQFITYDGGHSWPGGKQTPIGDPVSEVLVANDLMWDFFEKHTLQCNMTTTSRDIKEEVYRPFIYPNPATSQLNIRWPNEQKGEAVIYNSMGSPVLIQPNLEPIDLFGLLPGIYFILIESNSQQHWEKIIII